MIIINLLIAGLFIVRLLLLNNKVHPIMSKSLQWIIVILFSFVWGIGGYIQYPFFANLVGFIILHFWLFVICISVYKLIQLGLGKIKELNISQ